MDNVENVRNWYRKAIVADFYVRAESPSMATGSGRSLPDTVGPDIKKRRGIETIDAPAFRARQGEPASKRRSWLAITVPGAAGSRFHVSGDLIEIAATIPQRRSRDRFGAGRASQTESG